MPFRSGTIALIGRPNVGKSTLLNILVGDKIAIVTAKPQTTRNKILGIRHLPRAQLIFLDTPGLHKPHRDLNDTMIQVAKRTLLDADLILWVKEPKREKNSEEQEIMTLVRQSEKPFLVVINKIDTVSKDSLLPLLDQLYREIPEAKGIIPVSAVTGASPEGEGIDRLLPEIVKNLPEGPPYYEAAMVTDQTERFLVTELIREQILNLTREEIPYSVAVTIDEFKEPTPQTPITHISATIHVEKDSQKGIVVGKGGSMIKQIGEASRKEIEKELNQKVFLKLFVKVSENWSRDPQKLREFGYGP
ncbi:MAG: GTPase Era [Deltaproteobacteria bacterium]|nr:GTPase Era [Deltaproteobacteria bacterium]